MELRSRAKMSFKCVRGVVYRERMRKKMYIMKDWFEKLDY